MVAFILLASLVSIGGYVYYTKKAPAILQKVPGISYLTEEKGTTNISSNFSTAKLPQLPNNASEQLQTLGSRATEVTKQAGSVLGTAVQQASGSDTIQDRAFEYGRYLYCQQVVKDYESKQP